MASKRVRQTSLFETLASAKRNCQHHSEEDDHSLNCSTQTSGDAGSSGIIDEVPAQNDHYLQNPQDENDDVVESGINDISLGQDYSAICCMSDKPFQPVDKRVLSGLSKGDRNFVVGWYKSHYWLTACTSRKKVFCYYCRSAEIQGMLTFNKRGESTFSTVGYDNWKKAVEKFRNHEICATYQEAVMKWKLAKQSPVNEQLNSQVKKDQKVRRQGLLKQLHGLKYLVRHGMAIRGHKEVEGNLHQLLMMWSNFDSDLKRWISENKYISHDIMNEQIEMIWKSLLCVILENVHKCTSPWYSLIGDKATDVAHREQFNLSIRWVDNNYEIHEDPLGLFCLPNTTADTLV